MFLKVKSYDNDLMGVVNAPPSKSYSHRAVIISSLSNGVCKLSNVLLSGDVLSSINACRSLGADIDIIDDTLVVHGTRGVLHNSSDDVIDLGNSGTTLRLLTSISSLSDNSVVLSGDDSLKTRPMGPLLDALENLGVDAVSLNNNDKAPICVSPGYSGGDVTIKGDISSQFISSILISAPFSVNGVSLNVLKDFVSKPYVDMTIDVMEKFGVEVKEFEDGLGVNVDKMYSVDSGEYVGCDYTVEGDFSSASYLFAACAIGGGEIKVTNLFEDSKQGDKLILDILSNMGCDVEWGEDFVLFKSDGDLRGVDVDLSDAPDLLLTVAILAACASGETRIGGVEHARLKETDRISTCCVELEKLGVDFVEFNDGMLIKGGFTGGVVDSHKDHRLAMAFSLLGLKEDVMVFDGDCFNISFPNFIEAMGEIGVDLELI